MYNFAFILITNLESMSYKTDFFLIAFTCLLKKNYYSKLIGTNDFPRFYVRQNPLVTVNQDILAFVSFIDISIRKQFTKSFDAAQVLTWVP